MCKPAVVSLRNRRPPPPPHPRPARHVPAQDAKLHVAAGGSDEQVALTLYQCGTLQASPWCLLC